MQVNYHPPSELDAHVSAQDTKLRINPRFYKPNGSSVVGIFQVLDSKGKVLDRAVISVSGNGKITLAHRTSEVKPVADTENGDTNDDDQSGASASPDADASSTR